MQFADPVVEPQDRVLLHTPVVADVIMAVVGIGIGEPVDRFIIGDHHAAFAGSCDL